MAAISISLFTHLQHLAVIFHFPGAKPAIYLFLFWGICLCFRSPGRFDSHLSVLLGISLRRFFSALPLSYFPLPPA